MKIKELLAKPGAWTRYEYARTATGLPCSATSRQAVCWCLRGAVLYCYDTETKRLNVLDKLESAVKGGFVVSYNDAPERTHAEILALVEKLDV